ncbi:hypothetical protein [Campylobacter concisus]|uniref:hypothetical protein n=1 Tax=Campylobacter concisus TaxID=199 RepID=UPI001F35DABA|nr:hypothetical protein [Campylobacter concisus]
MWQKVALLALLGMTNLYALSLNGTAQIKSPLSVEFGLEDKVDKNFVGMLSDKKLLLCQPALMVRLDLIVKACYFLQKICMLVWIIAASLKMEALLVLLRKNLN